MFQEILNQDDDIVKVTKKSEIHRNFLVTHIANAETEDVRKKVCSVSMNELVSVSSEGRMVTLLIQYSAHQNPEQVVFRFCSLSNAEIFSNFLIDQMSSLH